jgi:hypothetical protein
LEAHFARNELVGIICKGVATERKIYSFGKSKIISGNLAGTFLLGAAESFKIPMIF